MKRSTFTLTLMIITLTLTQAQEIVRINTEDSAIQWKGSHSFSFGSHEGTVKLKSGELTKVNGKVTKGRFVMDMNTIVNTDGDYSQDLIDHLKSEDFFFVDKYPTAELIITKTYYHNPNNTPRDYTIYFRVNADLTIRGITQPIEFEAETENHSEIRTRFKIDRTRWKINHATKGLVERLKNSIISDAIEFNISLKMD